MFARKGLFLSWKSLFLTRNSHGLRDQNRKCPPLVVPSTKVKGKCKLRRHRAQEKNHQKGKKEWMGTTTGNGLTRIESPVYCHHTHPLEAGNAPRNRMQHSSVLYQDDLLLFLYLGHKTNQSTTLKKTASLCKMLEYYMINWGVKLLSTSLPSIIENRPSSGTPTPPHPKSTGRSSTLFLKVLPVLNSVKAEITHALSALSPYAVLFDTFLSFLACITFVYFCHLQDTACLCEDEERCHFFAFQLGIAPVIYFF